jgi:UDP-glucose 4-epimerase
MTNAQIRNRQSPIANPHCLVIGGAGVIGSHVTDALLATGASVIVLDNLTSGQLNNLAQALRQPNCTLQGGSITDREALARACQGADYVFHLAVANMTQCAANPRLALEVNVAGTWNVFEAATEAGVRKVVFSSAGAVYGQPRYVPVDEDHSLDTQITYGASKVAGERFLAAFHRERGLAGLALRYFNVYGPRHDHPRNTTQIIPRWLDCLERGEPPIIFGDGEQTMDFVYIEDVARANLLAAQSDVQEGAFNVASGVETSANELARLLIELTGVRVEPVHQGHDPAHVRRRWASTARAWQALGFRAQVGLREGLEKTIAWRRSLENSPNKTGAPQSNEILAGQAKWGTQMNADFLDSTG